ncbi:alpha-amylase family glycosyl hydrolase [Sphingomonas sp. BIUV-7]|uniref:Alpha-amylase family glycosyl hydrolase n=1 Tax=Sphingomonas natans TaxID=3063330 RepID=A0ABT8YDE6_9SPHN|nr:alpha-amylase family glycosyl hydrolase [Sphingomonas sp. BIUV-7]MDO6416364.1 alpha-amylase family glycosyl hydrolase [Sphingomonas sp. BIUV-7]
MTDRLWWEKAVVYQIYPRSFQDTNGDGIGDLAGIERRLDHFVDLGIDAIWISPIYPSPMVDFGYDVSDYTGVHPMFGTLEDFDRLIAAAHARGLKLLLDFVPNHSSDQHPWFLESRSSRDNPKRDWYIWRDAASDGGPPNNWISDFGGSAWQWDGTTGQYYYHAMLVEQPDLNWRDPGLKAAMLDAMRFWYDRGVDGFRVDILWHMIKAAGFPDNPLNPAWTPGMADMHRVLQLHSTDQPEIHGLAAEMRALADSYGDRLLVGEIYLPLDRLMAYYGSPASPGVQLPFNFQLIDAPWDARGLHDLVAAYEAALPAGGWPNWVLGNHDRPRAAARLGQAQARVAAMLLLTLRGTPTIYYGDEIGIGTVDIPPDRVADPRELREPGLGFGRDPVRTPMAWDGSAHAGFTTGDPWLPLHADWRSRNVAAERQDSASSLSLHRDLLRLRRAHPALAVGDMTMIDTEGQILAYERHHEGERAIVLLNLGSIEATVGLPKDFVCVGALSTIDPSPLPRVGSHFITLKADEGLLLLDKFS